MLRAMYGSTVIITFIEHLTIYAKEWVMYLNIAFVNILKFLKVINVQINMKQSSDAC